MRREVEANKSVSYVIPDCRFENEVRYLRERLGATVYWVEAAERVPDVKDTHASEPARGDMIHACTGEIANNADIPALHTALAGLFPAN